MDFLWLLAPGQEDDVPLRSFDILVLENKELIDTILLESTELCEKTNWSKETLLNDEMLLAPDLSSFSHIVIEGLPIEDHHSRSLIVVRTPFVISR